MQSFQKLQIKFRKWRYPGGIAYWERRYASGGNSGSGSSGLLAAYKAEIVNQFVKKQGIQSVLELGCGDGQQLQLAQYPQYTGLDVSPSSIETCKRVFSSDATKKFDLYDPFQFNPLEYQSNMSLSMEVIFHLTEENTYQLYLKHLFSCAQQWVVIFASNTDDNTGGIFPHFKPRQFLPDIPPGWELHQHLPNPHFDISISEFFIFEKRNAPEIRQ